MTAFFVFIVAPLIELFVLIQVGGKIGALNTIGLLLISAFVGMWLVKRAGMRVWARFAEQLQARQPPTKEVADGLCLLLAGALFIAPGLISDVLGLLLILPPTRALFRRWLLRRKGLGAFGQTRLIRATYGGPMPGRRSTNITDITDTTGTESRGELEP